MSDVVIVGGGVIGLTIAYELAGQGTAVTVLDQATPGKEASWAGAGMLPPGNVQYAQTPQALLRAESHALWTDLTQQLYEESGR
jgi:glycine oxidase